MYGKKIKVEINDNFNMIFNYIVSAVSTVKFKELLQYCIDYDLYEDFYVNLTVFEILRHEKNVSLLKQDNEKNIL